MTMEELASVQGRAWDDVDVSQPFVVKLCYEANYQQH